MISEAHVYTKSEPGAVATGHGLNLKLRVAQVVWQDEAQLSVRSGRIHHPTRAARAGTPVRPGSVFTRPTAERFIALWSDTARRRGIFVQSKPFANYTFAV